MVHHTPYLDYTIIDGFLYKLNQFCVPSGLMFGALQRCFFWPFVLTQVEDYITRCSHCSQSKLANNKLGLYQLLPISSITCESISMDFVNGFPTINKIHGANLALPLTIISNCDSQFLNHFWRSLCELLGCQLHFSTSFHPQTNGQTKKFKHTLVHVLYIYHQWNKQ